MDKIIFILSVIALLSIFVWMAVGTYKEWHGQKTKGLNHSQEYFIPPVFEQELR